MVFLDWRELRFTCVIWAISRHKLSVNLIQNVWHKGANSPSEAKMYLDTTWLRCNVTVSQEKFLNKAKSYNTLCQMFKIWLFKYGICHLLASKQTVKIWENIFDQPRLSLTCCCTLYAQFNCCRRDYGWKCMWKK